MAGRIDDELKLVLTMDADGYIRKAGQVTRAQKDLSEGFDRLAVRSRQSSSLWGGIGAAAGLAAVGIAGVAGALYEVDKSMLNVGLTFAKKAADFESLTLALAAVDGGAKNAEKSLKKLQEIAKGPGLGVTEAIQTYSGMRRGGLDSDLAMSLTREIGNAVARSGGGKEMLGRAGLAVGQMATKPFLQGEELNQLTEAGIPAYKMIKDIFGTADTEELKKRGVTSIAVLRAFNEELKKSERVAGGAKNAFDNFDDAMEKAQVKVGEGINTVLTPAVNDLANELEKLASTDDLKKFGAEFATIWKDIFENLTGGAGNTKGAVRLLMESTLYLSELTRGLSEQAAPAKGLVGQAADKMYGDMDPVERVAAAILSGGLSEIGRPLYELFQGAGKKTGDKMRGMDAFSGAVAGTSIADIASPVAPTGTTPPKDQGDRKEPVHLLKEIADNTKPLRDIRDVMLGGGTFSRNAFNAVNMGAWTGTQGHGQIAKGMQMVMAGLAASVQGQFVDLGRMRHLDPGAL